MTGSLTPQSAGASDDLGNASYKVTGTGTANDAHRVPGVTLIDPTTGLPYAASGGTGGGGGAVTLIDGADVTQGASTDTAASLTIMGRLLKIAALFPATLGQKLSAASLGVVIASDQSAITTNGSQKAQTPLAATLATTVTGATPTSTGLATATVLGYDGAITIELVAVGTVTAQAVTIQIEGSLDNSNWYVIGTAQIDATANPAYTAAAFTLTPGNGTIRHLYAVRDNVAYIRLNPTANTLVTGLSGSILANPV